MEPNASMKYRFAYFLTNIPTFFFVSIPVVSVDFMSVEFVLMAFVSLAFVPTGDLSCVIQFPPAEICYFPVRDIRKGVRRKHPVKSWIP